MYKRVFLIVMDSVGVGESPDASLYGDKGTNTLAHISNAANGLKMPFLEELGIGNLTEITGIEKKQPLGTVLKAQSASRGKDTLTGHWEMMGLKVDKPFITFTDTGFPQELINELENRTGRKIVGNISASGTEIIQVYGEHQLKTGDLIVYTSADSVLQIAAHEAKIPLDELYRICEIAREITMKDEWRVARVIARPFLGDATSGFTRTSNRHDYSIKPFTLTALDALKSASYDVIGVGKIHDIFDGEGITLSFKTKSNEHGMKICLEMLEKDFTGLCFVNLVDFDALYGHRRDPLGYAKCLEEFDVSLQQFAKGLKSDDLLIITADHGNDPTHTGTDHTREYVPIVIFGNKVKKQILPETHTFSDIGKTILGNFKIENSLNGKEIKF